MRRSSVPLLLLACTSVVCSCGGKVPLTSDEIVARAQPSVFLIEVSGDFKIDRPALVFPVSTARSAGSAARLRYLDCLHHMALSVPCGDEPKLQSLVDAEYQSDNANGLLAEGETRSTYCWRKVLENPDRYLEVSKMSAFFPVAASGQFASGSGFAVSPDGILVTNAHVIAMPDEHDVAFAAGVLKASREVDQDMQYLSKYEFGPAPDDAETQDKIRRVIALVLAPHSTVKGKITGIQVALDGNTVDATPIAKGTPGTAEDVAVLRVPALKDKVVALPLGDSTEYQNPVQAMGFPGVVAEQLRVENLVIHEGEIHPVESAGGKTFFHLTAEITHGDSGGPVVDSAGKVVAINFAGLGENIAGQNFAIPINVAKAFLASAEVTPDVGPVTAHWIAGQDAFANHRYYVARHEFGKVAESVDNPYVRKAKEECDQRIKAGEDKSSLFAKIFY